MLHVMMIFGVVANPKGGSFSHAALRAVLGVLENRGAETGFLDLYLEQFQPILSLEEIQSRFSFDPQVLKYQDQLKNCSGLVLSYPDWWGMPPAILKGWLDRVIRPGVGFDYEGEEFEAKHMSPLLENRRAMVITSGDEAPIGESDALKTMWERLFDTCGISPVAVRSLYGLKRSTKNQRSDWIEETTEIASQFFYP